jgi:uracil-DNA glycosylase
LVAKEVLIRFLYFHIWDVVYNDLDGNFRCIQGRYGFDAMANKELKLQDLLQNDWKSVLKSTFQSENFEKLSVKVLDAYQNEPIYPPVSQLFDSLNLCSFENTRVVILGQDPYHGSGQAHGLSFSVPQGVPLPPSLKNIYKELFQDLGLMRSSGDLSDWAGQGVLLLNTSLTVRAGEAGSHAGMGWPLFTKAVLHELNLRVSPVVFLLWGNHAQQFASLIDANIHFVIKSAHPSPLSANRGGWFGSKPFSQTNEFLVSQGIEPIRWA